MDRGTTKPSLDESVASLEETSFREAPPPGVERAGDEGFLATTMLVVGAIPVVLQLFHGGTWGTEPSLGLLLVLASLRGLLSVHRRRRRERNEARRRSRRAAHLEV